MLYRAVALWDSSYLVNVVLLYSLFFFPVRDAWFDYFFDAVGRFRDMYQIVDIHVENFNDAYMYTGAPR